MLNFEKVLNLKPISIVLFISFIFTNILYSYPDTKDSLRLPINNATYNRMADVAGRQEDSMNPMNRRKLLGIGYIATIVAQTIAAEQRVSASGIFADRQAIQSDLDSISDEAIAYRVAEFLTIFRDRLEKMVGRVLLSNLDDLDFWQGSIPDFSKADIKKAHRLYKESREAVKKQKHLSDIDIVEYVINSIRSRYQRIVDTRSHGRINVSGEELSIIAQETYQDMEIIIAEPAIALNRCRFNATTVTTRDKSKSRIVLVVTNANLFIDEVIIPLINGRKVVRWVNRRLVMADPRVQNIFADTLRKHFAFRSRQECFNILRGISLRHEMRHQKKIELDIAKFGAEIKKIFDIGDFLQTRKAITTEDQFIDAIARDIAEELDVYLDELEGDFPPVSFIRMLEIIERDITMPKDSDNPTYAALSIIFAELCRVNLLQVLFSNSSNREDVVKKIKNYILSNFNNSEQGQYRQLANNIRMKYGLPVTLAKSHLDRPYFSSKQVHRNQL